VPGFAALRPEPARRRGDRLRERRTICSQNGGGSQEGLPQWLRRSGDAERPRRIGTETLGCLPSRLCAATRGDDPTWPVSVTVPTAIRPAPNPRGAMGVEQRAPAGSLAHMTLGRVVQDTREAAGLPNSRSPVSPSRWSGQAHTRHQRSPFGENHRPVHEGVSWQWVLWSCCEYTSAQHRPASAMKPGERSPGSGIGLMGRR
jgi:hypothetical protein